MSFVKLARCVRNLAYTIDSVHILAPVYSVFRIYSSKFLQGQFHKSFAHSFLYRKPTTSSYHSPRYQKTYLLWAFSFPFFSYFSQKEEEEESEIIMMMKYAILASRRGEDAKAEQLLHVALKAAQEMDDEKAITYIYDLMANFALKNQQYEKAKTLFVDVLKRILRDGKSDDDNAVVEISLKLATIYFHLDDLEKAASGFQFCIGTQETKLQAQGEENVDEDTLVLWAMSHDWYARFLLSLRHYDKAKQHFLRAYDVCIKVKGPDDPQTAVLLNDLGSVCSLQQKYDEAVQYLKEAIRVGQLCSSEDLASFYVNLGTIYMQKKVFEKAEKYCNKGMKIAKAKNNDEVMSESSICLDTLKELRQKSQKSKEIKVVT